MSLDPLPATLVQRLRERAADPDRRTDGRPSVFASHVASMSIGDMLGQLRGLSASLSQVVRANQAGSPVPSHLVDQAEAYQRDMSTPAPAPRLVPASEDVLAAAESVLGFPLPVPLRQLYVDVADGGVGPGAGILSAGEAARAYRDLVDEPAGPGGQAWPADLVPFADRNPGYDCIDRTTGRIVAWDPEEIEGDEDRWWRRSFRDDAPSLAAYVDAWIDAPNPYEVAEREAEARMVEQARAARAHIATLSPAERAAMGLPEEGWEAVVWGGIGWDGESGR